jgi:integrase/recombinase XerD
MTTDAPGANYTLYRRHTEACVHRYDLREKPQAHTDCTCAIWAYRSENGRVERKSVKCRDWKRALRLIAGNVENAQPPVITLKQAVDSYIEDCEGRLLAEGTVQNYKSFFGALVTFAGPHQPVSWISLDNLSKFRASWTGRRNDGKPSAFGGRVKISYLRAFCAWLKIRKKIEENDAKAVKMPNKDGSHTRAFTDSELERIRSVAAKNTYDDALIKAALYTGFRIGDIASLKRSSVDFRRSWIQIVMQKTRTTVQFSLHPELEKALQQLPVVDEYFFRNGVPRQKTGRPQRDKPGYAQAAKMVSYRVAAIFEEAGVTGTPHMFRDTFAIRLLTHPDNPVDLRIVQKLLGHKSIKTTEDHYAPFVNLFQEQMNGALRGIMYGSSEDKPAQRRKRVSGESGNRVYEIGKRRRA